MEELIFEALLRKARSVLRRHQAGIATDRKYARKFTKRTGVAAGRPRVDPPGAWQLHPHYDPAYCIRHAKFLSRTIWQKIQAGTYEPTPAIQYEIEKPGGGIRTIMAFAIPDAAVANVVHSAATRRNINVLSSNSYAYRPDKSVFDAVINLRRSVTGSKVYVVQYDFSKYFDTIDQNYLKKIVGDKRNFILSEAERNVVRAFLAHRFARPIDYAAGTFETRSAGVPQGSSLSLFLSNAAGHALDLSLERMNGSFVRFADDVVAVTQTYTDALRVADEFRRHCEAAGLKINREKSPGIRLLGGTSELEHRIMAIDDDDVAELKMIDHIDYLGHRIKHDRVELPEKSIRRIKRRISSLIHKHLFLYTRSSTGVMAADRIGPGFYDWDFVTCLNELRKYIYGGLGETQIRQFLDHNQKLTGIRGLMGFMPLMTNKKQLADLDGWLLNILMRAQRERCRVAARHGYHLEPLTKDQILSGSWYVFPTVVQDAQAPSFVRAWRAARKFYLRYGLAGIEPPAYYSMIEYQ